MPAPFYDANPQLKTLINRLGRNTSPICESLRRASQWFKPDWLEILPEPHLPRQPMARALPKTLEPAIAQPFVDWQQNCNPEKYLARIQGAKLKGLNGVTILPSGHYMAEPVMTAEYLQALPEYSAAFKHLLYRERQLKGCYYSLLLFGAATGNYYHWLHDIVGRLYLILEHLPPDVQFIVPPNLQPWQREMLQVVGIPADKLLELPRHEIWQVETLYFSPMNAILGFDRPEANHWLRQQFYRHFGIQPGTKTQRILISRAQARGRRLANQMSVHGYLRRYGFRSYCLEQMSLREKVTLFSQAEIVVAPHGAGLTNLLFAPEGTQVLEIFEPQHIPSVGFWSLSQSMGQDYHYLLGETVPNAQLLTQPDIWLPKQKLHRALSEFGLFSGKAPRGLEERNSLIASRR
jgi:hypothetical protein